MNRYVFAAAGTLLFGAFASLSVSIFAMTPQAPAAAAARENPFFKPSPLPFGAPPFDRIQDGDYKPALEAGIKAELEEIAAIAANPAAPSFENTLVALEKSGQLLQRVSLKWYSNKKLRSMMLKRR